MPALQHFFDAERLRRGWSMRETADRAQISLSKAYAIVNGDDNVEFETFENIATAFSMTPAELAIAIGKGGPAHDPDETHVIVTFRQIPQHKKDAAKEMLEGLAVPPVNRGSVNRGTRRTNKQRLPKPVENEATARNQDENGPEDSVIVPYSLTSGLHGHSIAHLKNRIASVAR